MRFLAALVVVGLMGCAAAPAEDSGESNAAVTETHAHWLSGDTKRRAEQLTSLFENSTIEIQYAYVENIDDGRGYTAGRAGFTTATGDALQVIELYTRNVPSNNLAKYIPRLRQLAQSESGDVTGLEGFDVAWRNAASNAAFRAAQDSVVDEVYFVPAMNRADALGLTTALARAAIYDAIIQHGEGDDADGLPALITHTNSRVGGTPANGKDEKQWLDAFFTVRRADLAHANDPDTRAAWAESVNRVDALRAIAHANNYELRGPIRLNSGDVEGTVP